jgi:phospholipid/cholesterol/gamma-HCH transport system substrate-binding protein
VRRLAILGVLVVSVAIAAVTVGVGGTSGDYRVDALFDNADYLIAGQDVKIAGARVGQIEAVKLTKDRKARVQMRIDPAFAPFRANAECRIRPQSLIGEKFVECEPGDPSAKPLGRHGGDAPTVQVEHTHSAVDLDVVFSSLRLPLRQRLSIVVNELGSGLVGRPAELNAAIRRANPALQQANRALAILNSERHTLGRLIDASDRVVGKLAERRRDVTEFIDRADAVSQTVASRRGDLDLAVRRLPPLLAQLEPAARDLTGLATDARPVVRALGHAAPQARALLADFDPLADAARPTLVKLSELSRVGRHAVRVSRPVARLLAAVTKRLPPAVKLALPLVRSLRDKNVIEQIGPFVYYGGLASSRFDKVSHILPSYQVTGQCQQFAQEPVEECDAHFAGMGKGGGGRSKARRDAAVASRAGVRAGDGRAHRRRGRHRRARDRDRDIARQAAGAADRPPLPGTPAPALPTDLLDWLLQP